MRTRMHVPARWCHEPRSVRLDLIQLLCSTTVNYFGFQSCCDNRLPLFQWMSWTVSYMEDECLCENGLTYGFNLISILRIIDCPGMTELYFRQAHFSSTVSLFSPHPWCHPVFFVLFFFPFGNWHISSPALYKRLVKSWGLWKEKESKYQIIKF